MIRILFVCLGNICRSPMAEFVFKDIINKNNLNEHFEIDSAGTENYNELCHAGIHHGTKEILKKNNVSFTEHYSRQIRQKDFEYFDYILAMDNNNIIDLKYLTKPEQYNKIYRLLDFTNEPRDIKDPWYTGNFEETYNNILEGCIAFLEKIKDKI